MESKENHPNLSFPPTLAEQRAAHPDSSSLLGTNPSSTLHSSSSSSHSAMSPSAAHQSADGTSLRRNSSIVNSLYRIDTPANAQADSFPMSRVLSRASDATRPLPAFGGGKPYPPSLENQDIYEVDFDGEDDPYHAQNWTFRKKIITSAAVGYTTMVVAFASSVFSSATVGVAAEFGVSNEVGILGISLYVLGFATGPSLWAPLSEINGRRLPILLSMLGFSIFSLAAAVGKDLQTVLISRFFGGFFGACPITVVAGVLSDMFDNRTRGIAMALFSISVFSGPLIAPFIGGFIATSPKLGWRWTEYLAAIMGFVGLALDIAVLDETYPPAILVSKARDLRRRTGNWGIHARLEKVELDMREMVRANFTRPIRLLFGELIVALVSVYMAFVYGILYLFLTSYPIVFQGVYGFSPGIAGLAFFGMIVGQAGAGIVVLLQQPWYQRKLAANNGVPVPEWRLPSVIAGGVTFAGGIFWFGWAGYRADLHWIVPVLSGIFTGFGLMSIFLQLLNYLVDAYLMYAASAIAGNTFLRSLCGAGFPLFAPVMFRQLGIQWAATLLGSIAVLLIPIPILFYVYGPQLRRSSHFAPTDLVPSVAPRAAPEAEAEGKASPSPSLGEQEHMEGQDLVTADDEKSASAAALRAAAPKRASADRV